MLDSELIALPAVLRKKNGASYARTRGRAATESNRMSEDACRCVNGRFVPNIRSRGRSRYRIPENLICRRKAAIENRGEAQIRFGGAFVQFGDVLAAAVRPFLLRSSTEARTCSKRSGWRSRFSMWGQGSNRM
jgi:hypothetical protein